MSHLNPLEAVSQLAYETAEKLALVERDRDNERFLRTQAESDRDRYREALDETKRDRDEGWRQHNMAEIGRLNAEIALRRLAARSREAVEWLESRPDYTEGDAATASALRGAIEKSAVAQPQRIEVSADGSLSEEITGDGHGVPTPPFVAKRVTEPTRLAGRDG